MSRRTGPTVGRLELDEIEAIVRSEWRRRLGPDAYGRRHPPEPIRALVAYALRPESPEASRVADPLVAEERARLRAQALDLPAAWEELLELAHAGWDVLSRSRAPIETILALMQRIDEKLVHALEWEGIPQGASTA